MANSLSQSGNASKSGNWRKLFVVWFSVGSLRMCRRFVDTCMLKSKVQPLWLDGFGHVDPRLLQSETRIQIRRGVYAHDCDVINVKARLVEVGGHGFEVVF